MKLLWNLIVGFINASIMMTFRFLSPVTKAAALAALLLCAACGGPTKPEPKISAPPVVSPRPAALPQAPAGLLATPRPITPEAPSLWADWKIYAGWKIQQHYYSGQFRLIDPDFRLYIEGSEVACRQALEYLKWKSGLRPKQRKQVFLIHGLASNEAIWTSMRRALIEDGYDVATVTYPSTEQSLVGSANVLERVLLNLDPKEQDSVTIIAHSLGGLVTRSALSRPSFNRLPVPVTDVIMLGTPNRGATLASLLRPLARAAVTASANDLLPERAKFIGPIAKKVRFGVIAGGRGDSLGYNPVLLGDDDGIVKVEETKADNMRDFLLLPVLHVGMTDDAQVIAAVRRFLKTGQFRPRPTRVISSEANALKN